MNRTAIWTCILAIRKWAGLRVVVLPQARSPVQELSVVLNLWPGSGRRSEMQKTSHRVQF